MRLPRRRDEQNAVKRRLRVATLGEQNMPPVDRIKAPPKNADSHAAKHGPSPPGVKVAQPLPCNTNASQ
jgi:hypothetical protein